MITNSPKIAPLMPIDYIFTGISAYPVEFVFYYNYEINFDRFKSALDTTLQDFYLVSSQLQLQEGSNYKLIPSPEGLEFETCVLNDTDMDVNDRYAYLNSVETREGEPLTKIRLTHVAGGTALAISISHIVADGFSCFYFLSQLAKVYSGQKITPPDYDRSWYINNPVTIKDKPSNEEMLSKTGFSLAHKRKDIPRDQIIWENLFISQDEISALQDEANKGADFQFSKNDVITAHLWKTYVPQWHFTDSGKGGNEGVKPNFALPFDARRFSDWVPNRYFGNGICLASGTFDGKCFLEASISELALEVRKTVDKVTKYYVQDSYDFLNVYRREQCLVEMEEFHVADPDAGILVTNLSRVPLEEIDFENGKPFQFYTATSSPGAAIVLPAENGVKVDVCCPFK